jgi:hypothetical protein
MTPARIDDAMRWSKRRYIAYAAIQLRLICTLTGAKTHSPAVPS